jgi:hypothetical protein
MAGRRARLPRVYIIILAALWLGLRGQARTPAPAWGERRGRTAAFPRALALRGGAWISEEEEDAGEERGSLAHKVSDPLEVQAMTEDALDAFVEQCAAQAAEAKKATRSKGTVPADMPYEDFVWTREFAEQGFDPLFMIGMTEEQAELARTEWVSRIMHGDDDADQLSEHYKSEGNRIVNEALKLKAQGNENYTKLHSAAIQLYTDALRQNTSSIVHRAVCHANRANSHLVRSNFGHAIRDCNATLAIFDAVARTSGTSGTSDRVSAYWCRPCLRLCKRALINWGDRRSIHVDCRSSGCCCRGRRGGNAAASPCVRKECGPRRACVPST